MARMLRVFLIAFVRPAIADGTAAGQTCAEEESSLLQSSTNIEHHEANHARSATVREHDHPPSQDEDDLPLGVDPDQSTEKGASPPPTVSPLLTPTTSPPPVIPTSSEESPTLDGGD